LSEDVEDSIFLLKGLFTELNIKTSFIQIITEIFNKTLKKSVK